MEDDAELFVSPKLQLSEPMLVRLLDHHMRFRQELSSGFYCTFYVLAEAANDPCVLISEADAKRFVLACVSEIVGQPQSIH